MDGNNRDDSQHDTHEEISPEQHDEHSISGSTPDPDVDDDLDHAGIEAGIEYNEGEELDIAKKVTEAEENIRHS